MAGRMPMMGGPGMYGMNRFGGPGGYGSGYGGYSGGPTNSPGAYQDQMGTMSGRLQIVSNAALNAAASETTVDADGRNANPFKIYFKDMVVVLVITPILIILAVSGALFHVGLLAGGAIASLLSGIGGLF